MGPSPNCNPIQIGSARAESDTTTAIATQALAATATVNILLFFISPPTGALPHPRLQETLGRSFSQLAFFGRFLRCVPATSAGTNKPVSFQQHGCCPPRRGESQHVQRPARARYTPSCVRLKLWP